MTNKKLSVISASAIALSLFSTPSFAKANDGFMSKADLNADQLITLDELNQSARAQFNAIDTNADGFLNEAEREAARALKTAERGAKAFDMADTNSDGVLSREEVANQLSNRRKGGNRMNAYNAQERMRGDAKGKRETLRATIDTNGDGTIDDAEKLAAKEAFKSRNKARSKGEKTNGKPIRIDSDQDGLISIAELDAATQAKFAKADANNDGSLSADELSRAGKSRQPGNRR